MVSKIHAQACVRSAGSTPPVFKTAGLHPNLGSCRRGLDLVYLAVAYCEPAGAENLISMPQINLAKEGQSSREGSPAPVRHYRVHHLKVGGSDWKLGKVSTLILVFLACLPDFLLSGRQELWTLL